jgi:hypothetical protein
LAERVGGPPYFSPTTHYGSCAWVRVFSWASCLCVLELVRVYAWLCVRVMCESVDPEKNRIISLLLNLMTPNFSGYLSFQCTKATTMEKCSLHCDKSLLVQIVKIMGAQTNW